MKAYNLFLFAMDPTHIGAGGYRLGRVDNTIVRDAGTKLPKIPGSAISGATRSSAIYCLEGEVLEQAKNYARATNQGDNASGGEEDPVAKYFGYAEGHEKGKSRIGALSFRDAEILFFPIPTMAGPKWMTTTRRLALAGVENVPMVDRSDLVLLSRTPSNKSKLNFGWLMLDVEQAEIGLPDDIAHEPWMTGVKDNVAVVSESIFSALVNANLETRTSVSIDFETGTAKEGALFSYEATPRGTIFNSSIEFDDARFPQLSSDVDSVLEKALDMAFSLGIGAMTTRGFGKMKPKLVAQEV